MSKATLMFQYDGEENRRVVITLDDSVEAGIDVTVSTPPTLRPLAVMATIAVSFHALIRHYEVNGEGANWTAVMPLIYQQIMESQRLLNIETMLEGLFDGLDYMPTEGGVQ